ncbi:MULTISPECIES: segregation/condensation protein A [Streptomyces]|uniref:segregation/condensation protein A n=1 Tax=Streptomyces TaxID=1883 RepID=UPI00099D8BCF|nr:MULTISPECIES: segregation/condensation protein A [Streptomyces]MYT02056.1 segregation/condensation protein A [Streptomyces sp. SID5469]
MTSYDPSVPASGPAGRRRVLGRGPGAVERPAEPPVAPSAEPPVEAPPAPAPTVEQIEPEAEPAEAAPPPAPPEPQADPPAPPAPRGPEAGRPASSALREPEAEQPAPSAPRESEAEQPAPSAPRESEAGRPASSALREPEAEHPASSAPREPQAEHPASPALPASPPGSGGPEEAGDGVFKVRLANFEGPFDLLLQLISKHKLDVTEVALSKVTDEFMAHIRAMGPDWDLDQTTEFLVVAATLLDLKAARLLPTAEVEDEADLALLEARDLLFARLLQYRAYKQIADIFNRRVEEEARRYPRTVGLEPHHAELLPEVVISIGAEGFAKLAVKAMQPKPRPQVYVDHIHAPLVSVQEQAGIVVARLRELGEASFRTLVEDTDDTLTVVARFLALLELYREKAVALDQETALGDLMVRWTGGEDGEQPKVTDEFDRPPQEAKEDQA